MPAVLRTYQGTCVNGHTVRQPMRLSVEMNETPKRFRCNDCGKTAHCEVVQE